MYDKLKLSFKEKLKQHAIAIIQERIRHASKAMQAAQDSANEEDKSSVGDKYETGRAMAQNERDIYARQLESANRELAVVLSIDAEVFYPQVVAGACVKTEREIYFFLTGLGKTEFEGQAVYFLSVSSPMGRMFSGKRTGDRFDFNNREIAIVDVF